MNRLMTMVVVGVACASLCEGREVVFRRMEGNASPLLAQTIKGLKDGDTLRFEKGDYHFHLEGTTHEYMVTAGCWNGDKDVVFMLDGLKNFTLDGGGSTFYWHGRVFPFHFRNCENLKVGNFTTTMAKKSVVELKVVEKGEEGFLCQFDDPSCFRIEEKRILFDTDIGLFSTAWAKISMHALNRCCINYLFAGDCTNTEVRAHMPAPHLETFAENRGNGKVFFRYRNDIPGASRCPFQIGEPMCFLLEIPRFRITYLFDACRDVVFHDATVQFGGGIALTAQLCENMRIERYNVKPLPGNMVANTADCMFLVNCRGRLEVKDCEITRSLDDALNCHGCYLKVMKADAHTVALRHVSDNGHYDGFFPYHVGDEVEFTHPKTRAVLGVFKVAKVGKVDAFSSEVEVTFAETLPDLPLGAFAEDLTWIPDVTVSGCHFHDTLHLRLSGRGRWLVENNRFERFCGILIDDLAGFWGEAGWVKDMTIRHNHFSGNGLCIKSPASSPRRHQGVKIYENTYDGGTLASLPGVANAEMRDNEKRTTPKAW